MDENNDREELQRKLEQSRRLAADQTDPVTQGWLLTLVRDLERRLLDQQRGLTAASTVTCDTPQSPSARKRLGFSSAP